MSEFLFIIPSDWTQIELEPVYIQYNDFTGHNINNWALTGTFGYIEETLKTLELIPQSGTVIDAKVFEGEVFAVKVV